MPAPSPAETGPRLRDALLLALATALPLALFLATASDSLQFDDGAELVACAMEGSTAHPPGFPAWVMLAHLWLTLAGAGSVAAVCAFVATVAAVGTGLLALAFDGLLARSSDLAPSPNLRRLAALGAALATATGATVWQWSNSAEVYALQLLATALVVLAVVRDGGRSPGWRLAAGLGLGLGFANHHVATILLLPLLPFLSSHARGVGSVRAARDLLPALGVGLLLAAAAYVRMAWRADGEFAFTFGEPSTPSRLWHHLRGGFFADSLWRPGVDYAGRAVVLATVLVRHLWSFSIPFAIGCHTAWRRAPRLLAFSLGYTAILLLLQLGRMHTPNMDATLLPALGMLGFPTALGLARMARTGGARLLVAFLVAALGAQLVLNREAADRSGYRALDAVLEDLDSAAPPRSIVLLSRWELLTGSLLARELRAWRPDLVILPNNLKGTHRDLLARRHPAFFAAVRPEFEAHLDAMAAVDPDHVFNDYALLETPELVRSYVSMLRKVLAVATAERRPVLCDLPTFRLLTDLAKDPGTGRPAPERTLFASDRIATRGLFFVLDGRTPKQPPALAKGWLEHPFLRHDLCAQAMLHDYRTAAKQMAAYWRGFRRDPAMAKPLEAVADRLDAIWRDYERGKPAPRR